MFDVKKREIFKDVLKNGMEYKLSKFPKEGFKIA